MGLSNKVLELAREAELALKDNFSKIDEIAYINTEKVLKAFNKNKVSEAMLKGSTGYGYGDIGRDALDLIYADVFDAESAIVRQNIINGTHALTIGLYGILRPGDLMLSITGKPYDTLMKVIGIDDEDNLCNGSLKDFGVNYDDVDLKEDGSIDFDGIYEKINKYSNSLKMIFIQRSKGYLNRPTLSAKEIGEVIKNLKSKVSDKVFFVVDNCYGEFCDIDEPTTYGADLIIGSLIKNPGGGMAESGGYLAGTKRAVELASYRFSTVGQGAEGGASLDQNKNIFKGLFYAPHTVAQAKKTALLASYIFEKLGYDVEPKYNEDRHDIIQTIKFYNPDGLCKFCQGIQFGSPIDSFVVPEPWDMPGYSDKVIMAAGAFTQGSSIEISADGPLRYPYTAYFQGGLTYESGKYAILSAADKFIK